MKVHFVQIQSNCAEVLGNPLHHLYGLTALGQVFMYDFAYRTWTPLEMKVRADKEEDVYAGG